MSFLRDIWNWFLGGSNEPEPVVTEQTISAPVPEASLRAVATPDVFDFQRLADTSSRAFLNDLRSIRPTVNAFEKAREELLNELRQLGTPRSPRLNGKSKDRR